MTDLTVKCFNSGMTGAPQISNNGGELVTMLDACLVNGFARKKDQRWGPKRLQLGIAFERIAILRRHRTKRKSRAHGDGLVPEKPT